MPRLDSVELVPFRAAIQAGAGLVMTAHIALPAVAGDSTTPATLSPRIITGLLRDSLGFGGVTITDAMTMEGVGKGYTTEQSSVLAVQAGADILLKPSDPTRAIDAVVAAVEKGEITRARIDSAVRRVLELKALTGVAFRPITPLTDLRDVVGSPEHRARAEDIATRAITLLRDREALVPMRATRVTVVQYMPETELRAGKAFAAELRRSIPGARVVKVSPTTAAVQLDTLARSLGDAETVVFALYVRRIEGEGRPALPPSIASWVDGLTSRTKAVVIAFGNPYLIRQVPSAGTYLTTYGVGDALERAAARAITGRSPITGVAPVSLPGFFTRGEGIKR
jgi:beta-N-acetylhexosaminidase